MAKIGYEMLIVNEMMEKCGTTEVVHVSYMVINYEKKGLYGCTARLKYTMGI